MRSTLARLLTFATFAGLATGCDTFGGDDNGNEPGSCPAVNKTNPSGKAHGEPCTSDSECQYGVCLSSPSIAGNTGHKFCTKSCTCGIGSVCGDDTVADGLVSTCLRYPQASVEPLKHFCHLACDNVQECQTVDPDYTACEFPQSDTGSGNVGVYKVCLY